MFLGADNCKVNSFELGVWGGGGGGGDNLRQLKQFWVSRFGGRLLQTGSMVTGSVAVFGSDYFRPR